MTYTVKELFYTLQGEGAQSGRAAVFCRFSGCNLWSGQEKDRQASPCPFCDTDFVGFDGEGGGKYPDADSLAQAIALTWPAVSEKDRQNKNINEITAGRPYVVFTGGEPLLQLDKLLIDKMHELGFEVGVETNGTMDAPEGIDWICVSPKNLQNLKQQSGQELKLLYPLTHLPPEKFTCMDFEYFFLQAVDEQGMNHSKDLVRYCLQHPQWRVSLQIHKLLKIP